MSVALFAAGNWFEIAMIVAFLIWGAGRALESLQDQRKQANQKLRRKPVPGEPRPEPDPRNELENFLQELGVKTQQREPQRREPAVRQPQRREGRKRRSQSQPQPVLQHTETVKRGTVSKHHLVSEIKDRHRETIHSQLEDEHLETHVAEKPVVAEVFREAKPATAMQDIHGDQSDALRGMLQDGNQLTRAFILGQVLSSPVGLHGAAPPTMLGLDRPTQI